MTVHRSENGILFSTNSMLAPYEENGGMQYSLMAHQQQIGGNHVAYLSDGHQQHLQRHLAPNEAAHTTTITVNPMAIAADGQAIPQAIELEACRERKKTFYVLISLIVLGISVMVITVITAIVIFFKCESYSSPSSSSSSFCPHFSPEYHVSGTEFLVQPSFTLTPVCLLMLVQADALP